MKKRPVPAVPSAGGGVGTPVDALVAERMGLPIEELTPKNVAAYQLAAFRRTLLYAREHSAYHQASLARIDPDSIQTMEDLRRVPFTTEEDLAGNEWQFQCVSASSVKRVVTVPTTGTRGKRKRLAFTETDQQRAIDFIYRGYLTMDCAPGERMLVLMSGSSQGSIGDLVKRAMAPLEMEIFVFGTVTDIPAAYQKLREFKPSVIEAVPWHAAALARYGTRFGNPERAFIRSVNLSADVVPDAIVSRLEKLWACTVHRHYGSTEMCIFGGVECISHQGYHLRSCDLLFEIADADKDGLGELVVTTLDREAMPLIRYRTGDIGCFTYRPCACGCRIPRLQRVYGRKGDIARLGRSSFFLWDLADVLYQTEEVVDFSARIVDHALLEVEIKTFPGETADAAQIEKNILRIPGIQRAVIEQGCTIRQIHSTTRSFPDGAALKKTILCENT